MIKMVKVVMYAPENPLLIYSMILLTVIPMFALFLIKWTRVGALFQSQVSKWWHEVSLTLAPHPNIVQLEMVHGFIQNGRS